MPEDTLFSKPLGEIPGFKFDDKVVQVFPDMIKRSVPGYESIIAMTGILAARHAQSETNIYDLGSSLGASTLSMMNCVKNQCTFIAVDNSPAMMIAFDHLNSGYEFKNNLITKIENIEDSILENASFIVMNFTLQFIPIEFRHRIIKRIFQALVPGGALLLSEKIRFSDKTLDNMFIDAHEEFKSTQGYSKLEIAQKRSSLENILIPETVDAHLRRFGDAGFSSSDLWFQCLNFCSMIAVKH